MYTLRLCVYIIIRNYNYVYLIRNFVNTKSSSCRRRSPITQLRHTIAAIGRTV